MLRAGQGFTVVPVTIKNSPLLAEVPKITGQNGIVFVSPWWVVVALLCNMHMNAHRAACDHEGTRSCAKECFNYTGI